MQREDAFSFRFTWKKSLKSKETNLFIIKVSEAAFAQFIPAHNLDGREI